MKRHLFLTLVSLFFCILPPSTSVAQAPNASLRTSKDGQFQYETFGTGQPLLILLHGRSGPIPFYQEQAKLFATKGYTVLLPHYFDATKSSIPNTANYQLWADVVKSLLAEYPARKQRVVIGYSLGASVALAAGSQALPVNAIAEWYGSLPDDFFYHLHGMPPLLILHGQQDTNIPVVNAQQLIQLCSLKQLTCENHIYPDQGHGFKGSDLNDADERTLAFFSRFVQAQSPPESTK